MEFTQLERTLDFIWSKPMVSSGFTLTLGSAASVWSSPFHVAECSTGLELAQSTFPSCYLAWTSFVAVLTHQFWFMEQPRTDPPPFCWTTLQILEDCHHLSCKLACKIIIIPLRYYSSLTSSPQLMATVGTGISIPKRSVVKRVITWFYDHFYHGH